MPILIEIVCESVEDAKATEQGGADRIELCVGLTGTGGLTPTLALLSEVKAATRLPVIVMVRPRPGGFCYNKGEIAVMVRDAEALVQAGADGLVFGILNGDGTVNKTACQEIADVAQQAKRQIVFHRAFDVTPDLPETLKTLIGLDFTRVLTSGGRKAAEAGAETLRQLHEAAKNRIEILPGGGIRAHNVRALVERTGCRQVHLAPLTTHTDPTATRGEVSYGTHSCVEAESVQAVRRALVLEKVARVL